MQILRDPDDAFRIADADIRTLVQLRFKQLGTFEDGVLIVVDPGDSISSLERQIGWPILNDPFSDADFGDPDFVPNFDILEEHHGSNGTTFYELHVDTSDDGAGITLFVPRAEGVSRDLLAMLEAHATPAVMDGD